MKVINQGSQLEVRKKAWWVGLEVACDECKHMAALEYQDKTSVSVKANAAISSYTVSIECPSCKGKMVAVIEASRAFEMQAKANELTEEEFAKEQGKLPI